MSAGLPADMIDIHCHILPGIDDGSPDLETSVAMASMAAADGIETIIATPHVGMAQGPSMDEIRAAVKRLNRILEKEGIALHVLPGAEVQSHVAVAEAGGFCLACGSFFLLEFPSTYLPAESLEIVYATVGQGLTPIIAHPERNAAISADPEKLSPLMHAGAKVQITGASLTGTLGPDAFACAHFLIQHSMVHFIATDSHSPNFRRPVLSNAVKKAAKYLGGKKARALVLDHPRDIIPTTMNQN